MCGPVLFRYTKYTDLKIKVDRKTPWCAVLNDLGSTYHFSVCGLPFCDLNFELPLHARTISPPIGNQGGVCHYSRIPPVECASSSDSARAVASRSDVKGKAESNPPALRGGAMPWAVRASICE